MILVLSISKVYDDIMEWLKGSAGRVGSHHVQVFVPSVDRDGDPITGGQEPWVEQCLEVMGLAFGGATAFPPARGVWRDDDRGGKLVYDDPVVVFSYAPESELSGSAGEELVAFLMRLGRETNQGEVGVFVDGTYYGIQEFDER